MLRYEILEADTQFHLQQYVNDFIYRGFIPVGGLVIENRTGEPTIYYQAMFNPNKDTM
jgi:hypothetical protein